MSLPAPATRSPKGSSSRPCKELGEKPKRSKLAPFGAWQPTIALGMVNCFSHRALTEMPVPRRAIRRAAELLLAKQPQHVPSVSRDLSSDFFEFSPQLELADALQARVEPIIRVWMERVRAIVPVTRKLSDV